MLGDAARLLRHDVGRADGVEQRGLAVIDMAHDGDHRRARLEILGGVLLADEAFLDVGLRHAADRMPELLGDQLGGIGVDHVGDLVHLAVFHQIFDDVDATLGHAVGELLNGDRLRHHDLALNLLLRLRAGNLLLLALAVALERGEAALALLLVERVGDGEAAAYPALLAGTRLDRDAPSCCGGPPAGGPAPPPPDLGEVLAGGLLALAARLGLGLQPRIFLALPLDRFLVLLGPLLLGGEAAIGVVLDALALLGLALAAHPEARAARASFSSSDSARSTTPGRRDWLSSAGARFCGASAT